MDTVVGENVRKTAKEKSFLPDELITNILIRLPVKSVVKFGIVCRKWREITLDLDFVDLHKRSSNPVILVSISKVFPLLDLFAFEKWWEFTRTRLKVNTFPFSCGDFPYSTYAPFSQAGLIVLRAFIPGKPKFCILNPARPSNECVIITLSEQLFRSNICAVYYHPFLKEYVIVWKIDISGFFHDPGLVQYKLLSLGSYPSLKMIRNPFNYRFKDDNEYAVFINIYLYWMVKSEGQEDRYSGRNDILEFDIISEEFMVIPCPVPLNTECMNHQTHLLNSDGDLFFLLILPNTITIWRLKDSEKHLWTSTEYRISIEICHSYRAVDIIAIVDGILAFQYSERLFICNLREGIVKEYPKRKYNGDVSFFSHQMSLVSLKNCKSALYINKDGEVGGEVLV